MEVGFGATSRALFTKLNNLRVAMIKKISLLVAVGVAAFLFSLTVQPWLKDPLNWSKASLGLWPLFWLVIFSSLLAMFFMLVEDWGWKLLVTGVVLTEFWLMLGGDNLALIGLILAFFFQLSASRIIEQEKKNRLIFNIRGILKIGTMRILTSVLVVISFAYFLSSDVRSIVKNEELPFGLTETVKVVVDNYVGEQASPQLRVQVAQEAIQQINHFLKPYFKFFPPLLAFGLFLALQGVSFIFLWLSLLLSFLIFNLLKACHWAVLIKSPKEAETIVF